MAMDVRFLLVCVVAMGGCRKAAPADDAAAKPAVTVQAEKPSMGSITERIEADAVLAPVAQAAILPKISAPVKKFYVQRGDVVKAGQLVATLENGDLRAAVMDSAGAYTAAKGTYSTATGTTVPEEQTRARLDVTQAKATLDLDRAILKSRQGLLAQGAIPGRDVDAAQATEVQAQAAYDLAQQRLQAVTKTGTMASLETARGALESAKGKYLGAEAQVGYTEIRTPIPGVVTDRPLFAGETAAAGLPIVTVMDTSFMLAKMHLAQTQAQQLRVGGDATMTVPGMSEPVAAKVSLVSPALDPGSTTVEVWLKAVNVGRRLKAGTPVHVSLAGRTVRDAMLIPAEAVQRSSEGGGKVVQVVAADGTTKKRTVTVGIVTAESAQILNGLKPEDEVITGGAYGLDDGTKVKVGPAEKKDEDDKAGPGDAKDGGL